MPNVQRLLELKVTEAMRAAYPEAADAPAIVVPAQDPRFGDYQANGAMALAKRLKRNPREVAAAVVARLDLGGMTDPPEIAGPGFLNFRLSPAWMGEQLGRINPDEKLGAEPAARAETVVVDYSAPNLAKEMHVGHLRSTIIGDALVRILAFAGHKVVRQNHVGDWGTQFGMIILAFWHRCMAEKRGDNEYIRRTLASLQELAPTHSADVREQALCGVAEVHQKDLDEDPDGIKYFDRWVCDRTGSRPLSFGELEQGYLFVNRIETLAEGTSLTITHRPSKGPVATTPLSKVSSRITAMLQQGGEPNKQELAAWRYATRISVLHCNQVYAWLGVLLTDADIRGESAYNGVLSDIVEALRKKGLLVESEGAQCVFLNDAEGKPLFAAKDDSPLPLIVQKSDEGYLYATTDLAAVAFRTGNLPETANPKSEIRNPNSPRADRILYVVDARQALHFRMLFAVAREAGLAPKGVQLEHIAFGTMMGADGRPFKTRDGGTVKLMDLLDEAEKRALALVTQKNDEDVAAGRAEEFSEEQRGDIARIVGIGAVKYADLSQNRTSDYVFTWEKMLSLQGNTAPYMQYAYARVRSIFRKGSHEAEALRQSAGPVEVSEPAELGLAKAILRFSETVDRALEDYRPNVLASYLYDLAQAFTAFYDACPVLKSDEPVRGRRLTLCDLTARVMQQGLGLLGIETAERM